MKTLKVFSKCLPRSNFINMFTRSFYTHRSQKRKKLLELTVSFALLGSVHVKASRKIMVKLIPRVALSENIWKERNKNENLQIVSSYSISPSLFRDIWHIENCKLLEISLVTFEITSSVDINDELYPRKRVIEVYSFCAKEK